MSVLVVDSDHVFREAIVNLLLICGIVAYNIVSSGQEALERMAENGFDIVIVNASRPDINGLQLAGELQQRKSGAKIILIIEDEQFAALNSVGLAELNFPTILKSTVNQVLPEFLTGD